MEITLNAEIYISTLKDSEKLCQLIFYSQRNLFKTIQ